MSKAPPKRVKRRLLTKDVLAAFGGSRRAIADALEISFSAVHAWGEYASQSQFWHLLDLKPELRAKVKEEPVKYKLVRKTVEKYVRVA